MSEKVKRWAGGECGGCIESPDGEHVLYFDYTRLAKRNVHLQEMNAAMEKVGTELEKYLNELAGDVIKFNIDHAVEAHVEDEMAEEWEKILNKAKEVKQ